MNIEDIEAEPAPADPQREPFPDGVYLGLPNDQYQSDPALGSSDLKAILSSAVQWHGRTRNAAAREALGLGEEESPDKARAKDAGKRFGGALHTIVLEGEEAFDALYCDEPEQPSYPATNDQIHAALLHANHKVPKSAGKRELQAEAALAGIKTMADWPAEREAILDGRTPIGPKWQRALRLTRAVMEKKPGVMRYLQNGRAEVSVFWTDATGLRLKCRFDYLRVRPVADLKSFAYREGGETIDTFVSALERLGYHFQRSHYMDARVNILPGLVEAGRVYNASPALWAEARAWQEDGEEAIAISAGDGVIAVQASPADMDFFRKAAADPKPEWVWISVMTQGVPEVDVIRLPPEMVQAQAAEYMVEEAKAIYRRFREKFGDSDDVLWHADRGLVQLTDASFHGQRALNLGAVTWETAT